MRKKIAFIKKGAFSYTNLSVGQLLARCFPEYEIEPIDVAELLVANRRNRWRNYLSMVLTYTPDLISRRRRIWDCYFHTPFAFNAIKKAVQAKVGRNPSQYAFTFQTQSLWDGSVPGVPHFVYTDHTNLANLLYNGFGDSKVFPSWTRLEQRIYDNATAMFTMSQHVKKSLIDQYHCPAEKISCVGAGCNVDYQSTPLQNDNYRNKHILFVGVEWERKGGPLLVEAFKKVLKKHPDARLTIVGSNPELNVPNCNVVGTVSINQVRQFYPQASIFCLPTRVEPFGIVFIEAMLYRIPVVAPNLGALPDFVTHNESGMLVQPNNVEALANALIHLLDHPEICQKMGEAGHLAVRDNYTWETVGQRIQSVIKPFLK
jgi:glycosyltransferase involved in cell wall biosynthesis